MKTIIAMLILGMALFLGCTTGQYVPKEPTVQVIPKPDFGNNPSPVIMPPSIIPEPKLYITDTKVVILGSNMAAIEFRTNVLASSSIHLIAREKEVAIKSISDKTQYHYYKFEGLKYGTLHYAVIEANANTSDKTTITFTTEGNYTLGEYSVPQYYTWFPNYYIPPYIPPVITTTPIVFWDGLVEIIVTP